MARLTDKVAVVTGAGRGIGQAIALRLATEGAGVVAIDKDKATATATAQAVQEMGRRSLDLALDVSDVKQIAAAVDQIVTTWGKIDILVNCAGIIHI